MGETLFNQFADEGALAAQRDFFLNEILKPIKEAIKSTNVNLGTIDSSQSKKSVDELSKTIDLLEGKLGIAQKEIVALTARLNEYAAASTNAAKGQKDILNTTADLTTSLKEGAKAAYDNAKAKKDAAQAEVLAAQAAYNSLKAKDGVAAAELKSAKATLDAAKAKRDAVNSDLAAARAALSTAAAKKTVVKETQAEQKAAEDAANDYLNLAKAYNDAALRAKNFALRLGENHPITVQAIKDANDMGNTLKRLDAAVGQHQRNVGNYANAMTGLGFSFTQVARELPSLAVNFQQFALAISNNLPFVADSIAQTKKELALLRAEGKQAPSLFSSIAKSILTWQTALAVGITLFTIFAKEISKFFTELFDGSTAFSRAQKELSKAMAEVNVNAQGQVAELLTLYKITQDSNQQLDDQVDATKKILEVKDKVNEATGENIQLVTDENGVLKKNTGEWEKLIKVLVRVEKTKALLSLIGEQFKKVVAAESKGLETFTTGVGDAFRKFGGGKLGEVQTEALQQLRRKQGVDDANAYLIAFEKRLLDGLITGEFDLSGVFDTEGTDKALKEINKLFTGELEFRRDQLLKIADDENRFIAERIKAREEAANIDKQIIRLRSGFEISEARRNAEFQIKEQKGNAENIKIIQSNLAKEIAFIQKTAAVDLKRINAERDEDILALQDEFYQELINNVARNEKLLAEAKKGDINVRSEEAKKEFEEEKLIVQKFYDQELRILSANLKQKKITLEEYNLGVKANDRALKRALIDAEIDYVKKLIEIERLKPDGGNAIALEARLFNLRKSLRDQDINDYGEYANKVAEINKKINEDIKKSLEKLADQVKETLFAALAGTYDAQINKIRDQIDAVNELKAAEIERVNSSTDTVEQKAARIQIIEARAQSQREALERRQRQIEKNRAIVERASSAFSITIGGIRDVARIKAAAALAYANAMATIPPPFNVPAAIALRLNVLKEIPISIATTAASLAAILATPIPRFYKGTESSPEGIAEVAERGPELAVDKKGNVKVYEKHTLTYLTKGTKIYPADATKDILNAAEQERKGLLKSFNNNVTISVPDNSAELKKQTKILERLENKSRIAIINNAPIETEAWYQQQFKH
jgi:hypothetical protein